MPWTFSKVFLFFYSFTTNFNFRNLVLSPDTTYLVDKDGEDIGTYIKTSEAHNIDGAYVRVRYTSSRPELTLHFDSRYFTTATAYSEAQENHWVYNPDDDFYYYIGHIDDDFTQFNAGYYVDNTIDNTISFPLLPSLINFVS